MAATLAAAVTDTTINTDTTSSLTSTTTASAVPNVAIAATTTAMVKPTTAITTIEKINDIFTSVASTAFPTTARFVPATSWLTTTRSPLPLTSTTSSPTPAVTTTFKTAAFHSSTLSSLLNTTFVSNQSLSTTFSYNQTTSLGASVLNVSEDERTRYLQSLQDETTVAYIPALVYLLLLAVVGLIGNSLVLFVYSRKFTRTSTRIFIMAIAGFDLVSNVIVIPGEIYDMFVAWDFNMPYLCKTRLFFNAYTTMAAAMLLVAVAVVRYRKICTPFGKQVSIKMAKIIAISIAIATFFFSIPYAIINGRQTKPTPRADIFGSECTIDDSYMNTIWPMVNSGFFILLFITCSIPLVILYILIGVKAWRHSQVYGVAGDDKGGRDYHTDSSGDAVETRSTEGSNSNPIHVSVSSRTRSYVKKKPGTQDETVHVVNENEKKEDVKSKHQDKEDDDDANVIEYVDDAEEKKSNDPSNTNNNIYSVRMVRAPAGDKVHINLSMVRELTVKLKAVQKHTQEDETDDTDGKIQEAPVKDNNTKAVTFHVEPETVEDVVAEEKEEKNLNDDGSNTETRQTQSDRKPAIGSSSCKKYSKSMDDITRLVRSDKQDKDHCGLKRKAAENEDIDLTTPNKETTNQDGSSTEDGSAPQDEEPMSEFARAMQWVDITYCLNEQNENKRTSGEDEDEKDNLSKKGSFSVSRKVSRDNSFLQRHRKLREVLTDTLTRARKTLREREAEAAGGEDATDSADNRGEGGGDHLTNNSGEISGKTCGNQARKKSIFGGILTGKSESDAERPCKTVQPQQVRVVSNDHRKTETGHGRGVRRRGIGRTTAMLIIISAVYVIGFLPFLGLAFAHAASPATFQSLSMVAESFYYLFLRSYFLNSAANPIIYSLCDINFRRQCLQLLPCSKP